LHQVGDLFELNVKFLCQKVKRPGRVWDSPACYLVDAGARSQVVRRPGMKMNIDHPVPRFRICRTIAPLPLLDLQKERFTVQI